MASGTKVFDEGMQRAKEDAAVFGLALRECDSRTKTTAAGVILDGLDSKMTAYKARNKGIKGLQQMRDGVMDAMDRQDIDPPPNWQDRMATYFAAKRAAAEKLIDSAAYARAEGEKRREFEQAWLKEQAARANKASGSTTPQPASSGNGQED